MNYLPVLVVEDDRDLRDAICVTLELAGHAVLPAAQGSEALALAQRRRFGLVLSDVQMQPMDGLALLQELRAHCPALPVVLMTAFGDIGKAVEAMRAGASDYLLKPFEPAALLQRVERYCLQAVTSDARGIVAEDPKSGALFALAKRVAASATSVLLTGESGCGKEVLAQFIHRHSPRSEQPFVAINCAAIPDNLLEATLFGFEKGSFTGAVQSQAGKFEQAQGGTLLLDEISEMPLALQAKLLRVLQEREVERLGAKKAVPLDIRVIATSNRDLRASVEAGTFRGDLYYRLSVFPLHLPPLRERGGDILPLARHFIACHAHALGRAAMRLSDAAERRLAAYAWPGNVRELENVVQRAMIFAAGDCIGVEHLSFFEPAAVPSAPAAEPAQHSSAAMPGAPIDMKSMERAHIIETLISVNGSRKLAVQRLGISERTLRYKLQQYRMAAVG